MRVKDLAYKCKDRAIECQDCPYEKICEKLTKKLEHNRQVNCDGI